MGRLHFAFAKQFVINLSCGEKSNLISIYEGESRPKVIQEIEVP